MKVIAKIYCFIFCTILNSCNQSSQIKESTQCDLEVAISVNEIGDRIPDNFIGLSFETGSVRKNNASTVGYFFSENNSQSLHIFNELGISHLRIGGGSVDTNPIVPTFQDIDELFGFVRESGVKVIYSLRLLNGNLEKEMAVAKYIWDKYKEYVECFAIGNEPDWDSYHRTDPEITDYPTYFAKWYKFATAIKEEIPDIRFTGPNTGSNFPVSGAKNTNFDGKSWTVNFAEDLYGKDMLHSIAQHNYVGQDAQNLKPEDMIPQILSENWPEIQYQTLYEAVLLPILEMGYNYRLQESNSFSGQSEGGSNSFSTALFALDYMHWWVRHKCSGVNFHNKQWVLNAPIGMDDDKNLYVNPVGYGIKAFELSSNGNIVPIAIKNENKRNITAYAVRNGKHVYLTLINKEYGESGKSAKVLLNFDSKVKSVKSLSLESPGNDPYSKDVRLGGDEIDCKEHWNGKWEKRSNTDLIFDIEECSAEILDILID